MINNKIFLLLSRNKDHSWKVTVCTWKQTPWSLYSLVVDSFKFHYDCQHPAVTANVISHTVARLLIQNFCIFLEIDKSRNSPLYHFFCAICIRRSLNGLWACNLKLWPRLTPSLEATENLTHPHPLINHWQRYRVPGEERGKLAIEVTSHVWNIQSPFGEKRLSH